MNGPKTRTSGKPIHHFFFCCDGEISNAGIGINFQYMTSKVNTCHVFTLSSTLILGCANFQVRK